MPTFDAVLSSAIPVDVVFGRETLHVDYRPSALTPSLASFVFGIDEQTYAERLPSIVARVVICWDLLDNDGGVVALDPDSLVVVPLEILACVMHTIFMDVKERRSEKGEQR